MDAANQAGNYSGATAYQKAKMDRETLVSTQHNSWYPASTLKDMFIYDCAEEPQYKRNGLETFGQYEKRVRAPFEARVKLAINSLQQQDELLSLSNRSPSVRHSVNLRCVPVLYGPMYSGDAQTDHVEAKSQVRGAADIGSVRSAVVKNICGMKACFFVQTVTPHIEIGKRKAVRFLDKANEKRQAGGKPPSESKESWYKQKYEAQFGSDGDVMKPDRKVRTQDFLAKRMFAFDFDQPLDLSHVVPAKRLPLVIDCFRTTFGSLWQYVSAINETSPGKYHVFIRIAPVSPGITPWQKQVAFKAGGEGTKETVVGEALDGISVDAPDFVYMCALERLVATTVGSDLNVLDPLRILALPGFVNPKNGHMVTTVYANAAASVLDRMAAFRITKSHTTGTPAFVPFQEAVKSVAPAIYYNSPALMAARLAAETTEEARRAVEQSKWMATIKAYLCLDEKKNTRLGKVMSPFRELERKNRARCDLGITKNTSLRQLLYLRDTVTRRGILSMLETPDGQMVLNLTGKMHLFLRTIVQLASKRYDMSSTDSVYLFYLDIRELLGPRYSGSYDPKLKPSRDDVTFKELCRICDGQSQIFPGKQYVPAAVLATPELPAVSHADLMFRLDHLPFTRYANVGTDLHSCLVEQADVWAPGMLNNKPRAKVMELLATAVRISASCLISPCRHPLSDPEGGASAVKAGEVIKIGDAIPVQSRPGFMLRDSPSGVMLTMPFIISADALPNGHGYEYLADFSNAGLIYTELGYLRASNKAKAARKAAFMAAVGKEQKEHNRKWFGKDDPFQDGAYSSQGLSSVRWMSISLYQLCQHPNLLSLITDDVREQLAGMAAEVNRQVAGKVLPPQQTGLGTEVNRLQKVGNRRQLSLPDLAGVTEAMYILRDHPDFTEACVTGAFSTWTGTRAFWARAENGPLRSKLESLLSRYSTVSLRVALAATAISATGADGGTDILAAARDAHTLVHINREIVPEDFDLRFKILSRALKILLKHGYYDSRQYSVKYFRRLRESVFLTGTEAGANRASRKAA